MVMEIGIVNVYALRTKMEGKEPLAIVRMRSEQCYALGRSVVAVPTALPISSKLLITDLINYIYCF